MDHADVREVLEVAAAEPGGLDRLMAGDTIEAGAVAAHLAGCPDCTAELGRLRLTAAILRDVVPTEAPVELPPDLRERTLAYVRELGVPRPAVAAVGAGDVIAFPVGERTAAPAAQLAPVAAPVVAPTAVPDAGARRGTFLRPAVWVASIAAAVILSVVGTTMLFNSRADDQQSLQKVASWSIDIAAAPDAQHVALSDPSGGAAAGTLSFSATDGGLAVVADQLAPAPAGHEYRCWFETSAGRTKVGKMFFSGDIAYWVGDVEGLATATPGTKFGVSLEDAGGSGIGGDPVLIGTL